MDLRRGVAPETLAALKRPFFPILMVFLDWPEAPVYAHTGVGPITFRGQTWLGVGPVGGVDLPSDSMGGVASAEAVLSLIGVPADLDGLADDNIRNRTVEVFVALLQDRPGGYDGQQATGNLLVGAPIPLFSGTVDALDLDSKETSDGVEHTAKVGVSTGPSARSSATCFHSDEDQRRFYPWDTAGRHLIMAKARAEKLRWPEN